MPGGFDMNTSLMFFGVQKRSGVDQRPTPERNRPDIV
jgi:hypothetical protein